MFTFQNLHEFRIGVTRTILSQKRTFFTKILNRKITKNNRTKKSIFCTLKNILQRGYVDQGNLVVIMWENLYTLVSFQSYSKEVFPIQSYSTYSGYSVCAFSFAYTNFIYLMKSEYKISTEVNLHTKHFFHRVSKF